MERRRPVGFDKASWLRRQAVRVPWLLVLGLAPVCWSQPYQRQVSINWDFGTASDPLGWSPVASLSNFGVKNGALTFTSTAQVNSVYSPSFSIPATSMQQVKILMSSDKAGAAKVFWAPAQSGTNGGFQGGDENDFTMIGDRAFHHYYLPIDTSSATNIYRLRLDVPPSATVSIQYVTLGNLVVPSGSGVSPLWRFIQDGDALGWIPYSGIVDMTVSGGRLRLQTFTNATILAPKAQVTNQSEWLSVSGSVSQTSLETPWIKFNFVSSRGGVGTNHAYIPIVADSADHVYNQNVGGVGGWWSTVSQLSITVSENTTVAVSEIQISAAPQGAADLAVDALGSATSLVRAGSPFQVSCRLSNRGAQPVQQLSVNLVLPSDGSLNVLSSPSVPASLTNGYPQTLVWTLAANQSGNVPISVSATSQNGGSARTEATVLVNPSVAAQSSAYVPPPAPVPSNYDVGAYYFAGWSRYSHWDPIRNFPERMPVLGYYEEGDPQVMDWQIKWSVEHGVKFFVVDWSWDTTQSPSRETPNSFFPAFFSSAYRSHMQFCLLFGVNGTFGTTEFLKITQALIDKYFSQPEYYRINEMPVVIVYDPNTLTAVQISRESFLG